jgi:hypothetical protein
MCYTRRLAWAVWRADRRHHAPSRYALRTAGANLHPREKHERFRHFVVPQRGLSSAMLITAFTLRRSRLSVPAYRLPSTFLTFVLPADWLGPIWRVQQVPRFAMICPAPRFA